eukprot:scaffold132308_cov17-Prasinocladus_malaysianus.AAC.1
MGYSLSKELQTSKLWLDILASERSASKLNSDVLAAVSIYHILRTDQAQPLVFATGLRAQSIYTFICRLISHSRILLNSINRSKSKTDAKADMSWQVMSVSDVDWQKRSTLADRRKRLQVRHTARRATVTNEPRQFKLIRLTKF